mgnify:CR=1 FL=1
MTEIHEREFSRPNFDHLILWSCNEIHFLSDHDFQKTVDSLLMSSAFDHNKVSFLTNHGNSPFSGANKKIILNLIFSTNLVKLHASNMLIINITYRFFPVMPKRILIEDNTSISRNNNFIPNRMKPYTIRCMFTD